MEERGKRSGEALERRGVHNVHRGTVLELLKESYADWPDARDHLDDWRSADRDFFDNPDTIGACAVFTFQAGELVGLASWDPRNFPTAVIGHNCVRPARRGRGIGEAQLRHVLKMLADKHFRRATVTTGDSDFFAPARRMYLASGFQQVSAEPGQDAGTLTYSMDLTHHAADASAAPERRPDVDYPHCIYRSQRGRAIIALGTGAMFVSFVLGMLGVLPIDGASHIVFVLFAFGFLLPISVWFTYLLIDRRPIVAFDQNTVTFRSPAFPWRAVEIRMADILSCATRRRAYGDKGGMLCDLGVEVTSECLASLPWKGVLRKRGRFLRFRFTLSTAAAANATSLLIRYLKGASAAAVDKGVTVVPDPLEDDGLTSWPGRGTRCVIAGFNLLCAGVAVFVAVTGWTLAGVAPDTTAAICVVVMILSLIPFVATYTELGLNADKGDADYEESRERHARLAGHLPFWRYVFPIFGAVALASFLLLGRATNTLLVIMAAANLLSFLWFAIVFPKARSVLDKDDETVL